MLEKNTPVVIDNGSGMIKCGIAGDNGPMALFPAVVGQPIASKHRSVLVGDAAVSKRSLLDLRYPVERGVVEDWDAMEKIWAHCFSELRVNAEDHPVLLSEAPLTPWKNRKTSTEIMFEQFNVPTICIQNQAVLALYASGRTTGIVLDSGDGKTDVVPIYEGYTLPHAVLRQDVSGSDLTTYLAKQLSSRACAFSLPREVDLVRDIKERCCYVAPDFNREVENRTAIHEKSYELPDGQILSLGEEQFRCPEAYFQPSLLGIKSPGIHFLAMKAIMKANVDIRRELYNNFVIAGGSTMFPGLSERLRNEISSLAPISVNIKTIAPPERKYSAWIGGAILASLAPFHDMCINRQEFEEAGPSILHRKCL